MKRRLFVSQVSVGLLFPFIPSSLVATPLRITENPQKPAPLLRTSLAELLRNSRVGTPQQLIITRVYSPERTALQALQTVSQQDVDLINEGLGLEPAIDAKQLSTAISSAVFGSYSVKFDCGPIEVVWQCMARLGMEPNDMTGNLLIAGSQGVLQTRLDSLSCVVADLHGRIVQTNRLSPIV